MHVRSGHSACKAGQKRLDNDRIESHPPSAAAPAPWLSSWQQTASQLAYAPYSQYRVSNEQQQHQQQDHYQEPSRHVNWDGPLSIPKLSVFHEITLDPKHLQVPFRVLQVQWVEILMQIITDGMWLLRWAA